MDLGIFINAKVPKPIINSKRMRIRVITPIRFDFR
jgi:hypothetical protein